MSALTSQIISNCNGLAIQQLVQANNKENIKSPHLWGEPIGNRWIPPNKGQRYEDYKNKRNELQK